MIESKGKNLSTRVRGEGLSGEVKCELRPKREGVNLANVWGKSLPRKTEQNRSEVLRGTNLGFRKTPGN